jgi:hypothetical protein
MSVSVGAVAIAVQPVDHALLDLRGQDAQRLYFVDGAELGGQPAE